MSDEINEAEVRQTRDVAARMHETNEAKRTEYRMDPGLAAASLTWALAALDAERAAHAETRRERDRVDRECDRWQRLHNDRWGTDAATRLVNLGEHALVCEARAETAERERDEARAQAKERAQQTSAAERDFAEVRRANHEILAALDAERKAHEETRRLLSDSLSEHDALQHFATRCARAEVRAEKVEGEVAGEYFHAIEEALRANACDEMPGPADGSESGSPEHAAQLVTWAIDHSRSVILAALRSERDKSAASICDTWEMAQRAEQAERDLSTCETVLAHVRAALTGAENEARTARALAESRLRDIDTLCADRAAWTERAEEAEAALADVRQRCGGYPDSRVDGDGGIVAVVVRERDEAQAALVTLREEAEHWLDGPADTNGDALLRTALAATPSTLAGQVRARVMREAVATVERWLDTDDDPLSMIDRLRALAHEAERA